MITPVTRAADKKWTKSDVREMKLQLMDWWMGMAPYARPGATVEQAFATMPATVRSSIVVCGLGSFELMVRGRAASNRKTSEHYRGRWADTGEPRDPSGELVERFARMADEDDRTAERCAALVARVKAEGLPDEVATFVPMRSKGG